jgi:signal transduction histidine kinase
MEGDSKQVGSAALLRSAHLAPKQLCKAMLDREESLWLPTRESGVARIAHPNGSAVIDRLTTANGLSNDAVWDILEDREDNLSIAKLNGLDRLRKGKLTILTRSDDLPSNDVAALAVTQNTLFAGSASGLTRITAKQVEAISRDSVLAMPFDFFDKGDGHYRFEVKAANEDGVSSDMPATRIFSISPAIYQTAWFIVLCAVALLLATALLIRSRVRMAAKTLRLRFEERLEERARVAQDLYDDLLQDVMGISLQLEIADELTPHGAPGKLVLQRALSLSAATLAGGRGVLTTLRTTTLSLQDMMRVVAVAAEAFPEDRRSAVRLIADESELLVRASVGEEVVQIAREALRNALQHTMGSVSVCCNFVRGQLRLVVEDEGSGIESAILASGVPGHFGLRGMQERAERIAASLRFRSRNGGGMRVELDVPAHIAFVQKEVTQTLWTRIMARWRRTDDTPDRPND